ncbi:MAG: DEAD/DEAH box helicase family protein [Endomicrobiales bacterium]|nr:DEAD/DEAH box helicase family protein [Endomicrobiales bacterium]
MKLTPYHAKYFAYELTKKCSSDSMQKLMISLADARVDLNPHQVDAALFAFRSPFSKGVILADEVGLGKTIEAGIVISQKWAEDKRKILVITPSSLRKQWGQELLDKFFMPSCIIESLNFNKAQKNGCVNPFKQKDCIVITSYHFARSRADFIKRIKWDLVVIDEAHRLRNVYRTDNKIAKTIRETIGETPKLLLTATPLQNSLMELYGLSTFIDEHIFGDTKSYKDQFVRITQDDIYADLRERIKPICQRTLRKQVLEYIPYTNRLALVKDFYPGDDEQKLYDLVSEYLRRPSLHALPTSQRQLITLILRKLLASSSYAIAKTLRTLVGRLECKLKKDAKLKKIQEELSEDFEELPGIEDEWEEEDVKEDKLLSDEDVESVKNEIKDLTKFAELAESIAHDAKGKELQTALSMGFEKAQELGAQKKALIFTESRRTQEYLFKLLSESAYKDKIVLFNGTNSDDKAKHIYKAWTEKYKGTDKISGSKTADMRASLVDYFKDEAEIMIATESAAEGVNLQFCSLVVNYDLPWNPQRIEQRIGRCHRYGQKHDVVVVNFLNKKNAADQRVYELLDEKFKLFSGVFGASDEVLGSIESGVDFEKRIAEIYQKCRFPEEIEAEFAALRSELEEKIDVRMVKTRKKVFENLDEEVHEKLKISREKGKEYLNKYESWLWDITKYALKDYADFHKEEYSFYLNKNPFPHLGELSVGPYRIVRGADPAKEHIYRLGHPIAQEIIKQAKQTSLNPVELVFDYSNCGKQISILNSLIGKTGVLSVHQITIEALEEENYIVLLGCTDSGEQLTPEQCFRIFSVPAETKQENIDIAIPEILINGLNKNKNDIFEQIEQRNTSFFENEIEKLDKWAEDKRTSLKLQLKDFDEQIKELKRINRTATNLPDKLSAQKKIKELEKKRDEAWHEYDMAGREIEKQKDEIIDIIEIKLNKKTTTEQLFCIKWCIV